ncbi:putative beta-galactosidase [Helianthus annuus]|uniref:beta-galactosidase n=1 Tax=Helianthus annuus TaxID=4232 RepID=A0A9K3EA21_HELAN|nr:putative beta-galactosidase [Helianthus annuus]
MKFFIVWLLVTVTVATAVNVTYDHRPLVIDDKRRVLVSGSIHYPRSTPDVSVDDKQCGHGLYRNLRMVDWNLHEPVRGQVAEHNTPKDCWLIVHDKVDSFILLASLTSFQSV